nr:IS3 family transposase [Dysgonomonas sp. BGC7]
MLLSRIDWQNFSTRGNNQVWVPDITYVKTGEGWVYLTTVIDLFDRKVLGWHMSNNMRASDTVIPALNMACAVSSRTLGAELVFHSDRSI